MDTWKTFSLGKVEADAGIAVPTILRVSALHTREYATSAVSETTLRNVADREQLTSDRETEETLLRRNMKILLLTSLQIVWTYSASLQTTAMDVYKPSTF